MKPSGAGGRSHQAPTVMETDAVVGRGRMTRRSATEVSLHEELAVLDEAEGFNNRRWNEDVNQRPAAAPPSHVPNYYSYVEADASRSSADASITRYESSTSHTQQSSSRNNKRERIRRYQLQRRLLFIGRHTKTSN